MAAIRISARADAAARGRVARALRDVPAWHDAEARLRLGEDVPDYRFPAAFGRPVAPLPK